MYTIYSYFRNGTNVHYPERINSTYFHFAAKKQNTTPSFLSKLISLNKTKARTYNKGNNLGNEMSTSFDNKERC